LTTGSWLRRNALIWEAAPANGLGNLRGSPGLRRAVIAFGVLCAFLVMLAALPVSRGLASEHLEVTGEYGKEGPKATGLGSGCRISYNSASQRLYVFSDGRVYGLSVSPGSATPVGGSFPFSTGIFTGCGEPDMDVESSGAGNIYAVQSGSSGKVYGWDSSGTVLNSPWPVSVSGGGEICGVDTGPSGGAWAGDYSQSKIFKYSASGTPEGTISTGFNVCKVAVDHANGDVFAASYGGGQVSKFTAASGYTTSVPFPSAGGEPGMAVNGGEDKLYVGNGSSTVKVYDTETAALVETITLPASGGNGIAVDEGTDTLFATVGSGESGYIVEYLGLTTPKATTGEPTGNSQVSGTADPNGVGPITECYFEYGTDTKYEISPGVKGKQSCNESVPFNSVETVHADLPGLTGEETYHYRLVLTNGEPHVIGRGADKTIVPHNVKGLTTEAATEVTQESARLNASFEGTNEDTKFYFEWGQSTHYGHQTAMPPGEDAGTTTGHTPISAKVSGLDPGVTYHYRVVAENLIGVSKAADKTLKTFELPSIESFTSKNVTANSAEIDATINPHGFETEYFVEYGSSPEYGSIAPIPAEKLPAGEATQGVAVQLTGLEGITYHFRVVAKSKWGETRTGDQTFNFFPPSCPNSTIRQQTSSQYLPDCRAYELVSPGEAGGVTLVNAPWAPDPYAISPARFAFAGYLGALPGTDASNSLSADTYVATRTAGGWKSYYVGVPGSKALGDSVPVPSMDFGKFFDFLEGAGFEGVKQPLDNVPYIWDAEGRLLERWPVGAENVPGAEETEGAWQPSPDLEHLAFSSNNAIFTEGEEEGQTTPPGSAYDYDTASKTTKLISLTANGDPIPQEPGNTSSPHEFILFPGNTLQFYNFETEEVSKGFPASLNQGVSTDGSHILMSTSSAHYGRFTRPLPPTRLYMRVNDAITYEVSRGHDVNYVGMTADGGKVYFTSPEQLTSEDTDNSVDLYMWSQTSDRLTLVSLGPEGAGDSGNTDACEATWTARCDIVPVRGNANTDNALASESGDVYFYSPEQLEGQKGIPNRENLYVYRGGRPQFVASMTPTIPSENVPGPITRVQVSPDGEHAAFVTSTKLTSYDNNGFEEMYSFEPDTGHILCSSCKPNGEKPQANVTASKAGLFMSDDGRTFFETTDPLVSQDTNREQDVYEFVDGRPQLITSGTGTHSESIIEFGGAGNVAEEGLAGVSADGVNVYFSAREELVAQDKNAAFLVFYDARIGGGFPFEPPLAPCEAADECHGEGSSPPAVPNVASDADLGRRGNAPNPVKHRARKKHRAKKKRHRKHRRAAHRHGSHRHG
jgi:hypothetical protein